MQDTYTTRSTAKSQQKFDLPNYTLPTRRKRTPLPANSLLRFTGKRYSGYTKRLLADKIRSQQSSDSLSCSLLEGLAPRSVGGKQGTSTSGSPRQSAAQPKLGEQPVLPKRG